MAEARRRKQTAAEAAKRAPTSRMVLEKVRVAVIPDESAAANFEAEGGEIIDAWVERGVFEGDRMVTAIEAYVKPGTPEQRTGTFRAPPVSNWKGARRYTQPELVPVRGEALD